jgi:hypothetical protein
MKKKKSETWTDVCKEVGLEINTEGKKPLRRTRHTWGIILG